MLLNDDALSRRRTAMPESCLQALHRESCLQALHQAIGNCLRVASHYAIVTVSGLAEQGTNSGIATTAELRRVTESSKGGRSYLDLSLT